MVETALGPLADELIALFGQGVSAPLPAAGLDRLALRVFRYQLEHNPVYRRFCEGRGATAATVRSWTEIPPVPTTAFKHLPLLSAPGGEVDAVFRTSGTSRGRAGRGEHRVPDLRVYRAAALPNFRAHLLPEAPSGGDGFTIRVLALLPAPGDAPDSSLSAMAGFVMEQWGDEGSGWFVDVGTGVRSADLDEALDAAARDREPVLLLATAFSLVHWLDGGRARKALPEGSRVMETGGFKGRSRSVPRGELYRAVEERLGVPRSRIVNEYGMTELLSQFYEPVLRGEAPRRLEERRHVPPPWVGTQVLDSRSLEPLPEGRRGLLCHLDLANVGSVARILTEDVGVAVGSGFRVLGRTEGAEPRGCSLALEEIVEAARGR